ncbi:electron transfer flavoprotein subunit beta/FixA family protein, partial [Nocardia sp. NPDC059236]|uniref:electron transfer flavoprotein subunit beta/FixA family protein n=1 Tax=Nocardia sp. NPDC059236 TaxID=3346783 RepID=UPI003699CF9F
SELDEYAVEQALQIADSDEVDDAEITVLTVGPEDAKDALRKALSMGADKAVHVEDDDLHGTDALGTSYVLAKAIEKTGYDLVVCGMASTDGTMGVLPAMLAERLGVPQVTLLSEVSVTDQSGEARYPSFKGIMAAKKKPVESLDLDDLDIEAEEVGLEGAWTKVEDVAERPARTAGTVVKDEGDGGKQLAAFLAERKFV